MIAAGAGVSLTPPDLTVAAVRSAVRQLVEDQTYRQAAQRIKTECDAMPEPASIRPRLVQLASPPDHLSAVRSRSGTGRRSSGGSGGQWSPLVDQPLEQGDALSD